MGEFRMPSLGADMEAGTLVEWMVKPGDRVRRGDIIATVETQKGLFEVENYESGVMQELLVQAGTEVPVGTVLATISSEGMAPPAAPAVPGPAVAQPVSAAVQPAVKPAPVAPLPPLTVYPPKRVPISPSARKLG